MRTSILGVIVSAAIGLFAFFGVASPAVAEPPAEGSVQISGSGVWGPGTDEVKGFSAPGASFSFDFLIPETIPENPTEGTDFDWILNNKGVIDEFLSPFVEVEFFTADFAGMFDLIPKKNEVLISFYGPDIGSSLTIATGPYPDVTAGMQSKPASSSSATVSGALLVASGFGETVDVSPLVATGFGRGVPEPSTWVMMTLGFAGLAFAGYRTSRKSDMVA
jgi:hypothetical protein